jgi:hypothetical protein
MKGITLTFTKRVAMGFDEMRNPTTVNTTIEVADCLIAPIAEPVSAREQQAMHQNKDQVRIHLPKDCTDDVSDSELTWDGKVFRLDGDSVVFMAENTPTRWNRYFRAEAING